MTHNHENLQINPIKPGLETRIKDLKRDSYFDMKKLHEKISTINAYLGRFYSS